MNTVCRECGGALMLLTSLNRKKCYDCRTEFDWQLDEGQSKLINNNRADRKNATNLRASSRGKDTEG